MTVPAEQEGGQANPSHRSAPRFDWHTCASVVSTMLGGTSVDVECEVLIVSFRTWAGYLVTSEGQVVSNRLSCGRLSDLREEPPSLRGGTGTCTSFVLASIRPGRRLSDVVENVYGPTQSFRTNLVACIRCTSQAPPTFVPVAFIDEIDEDTLIRATYGSRFYGLHSRAYVGYVHSSLRVRMPVVNRALGLAPNSGVPLSAKEIRASDIASFSEAARALSSARRAQMFAAERVSSTGWRALSLHHHLRATISGVRESEPDLLFSIPGMVLVIWDLEHPTRSDDPLELETEALAFLNTALRIFISEQQSSGSREGDDE